MLSQAGLPDLLVMEQLIAGSLQNDLASLEDIPAMRDSERP